MNDLARRLSEVETVVCDRRLRVVQSRSKQCREVVGRWQVSEASLNSLRTACLLLASLPVIEERQDSEWSDERPGEHRSKRKRRLSQPETTSGMQSSTKS
jgi:hypothetical protein